MKIKRIRIRYILLTLLGLSMLPLVNLLSPGLPITHDGPDHVARIANFFASLSEGNIVPRWAANLNWGYGHPILMFLYPLPSYIASFFRFLGFSFVDSTKMVFAVSFCASVITMYLWVSRVWGKRAGFIAGLLYGFAPYRFVDLYVRGAIGEHVAFIFPPLILYCMYEIATKKTKLGAGIGLSVSMACLILAHNAISLMFIPIIAVYGIYLFFTTARKNILFIVYCFLSIVLGFGLSAFFWVPAFFEGKYTLRDIVTRGTMTDRFVPVYWFFISPWNYGGGTEFTKQLGFIQWIGIITVIISLFIKKNTEKILMIGGLFILLFSLVFQTQISAPIWKMSLLEKFQFPWRLLTISVFISAILSGIGYAYLIRQTKFKNTVFVRKHIDIVVIVFFILSTTYSMWRPKGYSQKPVSYYKEVYESTTDTGESSPIWSVRFMEHRPGNPMDIVSGQVKITPLKRTTTSREYEIEAFEPARLSENTLFFPGWKVYVDGVQTGVQFQDPDFRGLMTFRVIEGKHQVSILFRETKLRYIADAVSVSAVIVFIIISVIQIIISKNTKQKHI